MFLKRESFDSLFNLFSRADDKKWFTRTKVLILKKYCFFILTIYIFFIKLKIIIILKCKEMSS
ncbi:hypothetical protein AT727_03075 [Desulfitobacterium hafniense]|uniref:Uncharacterized protein n=1 Tax=Desulfitobacterium hafniense TaxID=49338 RepID=A0A0W1JJ07_DESHA|nr:hypothetical protein AT727_03075 [Desulfitobacterium hafniense]